MKALGQEDEKNKMMTKKKRSTPKLAITHFVFFVVAVDSYCRLRVGVVSGYES